MFSTIIAYFLLYTHTMGLFRLVALFFVFPNQVLGKVSRCGFRCPRFGSRLATVSLFFRSMRSVDTRQVMGDRFDGEPGAREE